MISISKLSTKFIFRKLNLKNKYFVTQVKVSLSVTSDSLQFLWTIAHQAPLPRNSPGKNTRVGCHGLLQGILLTQGSNPCLLCLLHWQAGILAATPNSYWYNFQAYSAGAGQNLQIHLTSIFLSNRMSSPYPSSAWLASVHHGNC